MGADRRGGGTVGSGRRWELIVVLAVLAAWLAFALPRVLGPAVNEGTAPAIPDPGAVYDPVAAGEQLPDGYHSVTRRDRIRPIYAPQFRSVADAGWSDDTLVLGVALDGEARAYPIRTLNHRELVLDRLGGTPIVASW